MSEAKLQKDEVTVSKDALREIMSHLETIEKILRKEDHKAPDRVSHE
jgi:hypothetical protein